MVRMRRVFVLRELLPEVDHVQVSFLDDLLVVRLKTLADVKSC